MFGLEILDVVIGLMFVYLLLSLLATAINEYISAVVNLRGKELARGLGRLLDDLDEKEALDRAFDGVGVKATTTAARLTEQFYNHPLIRPLATRRGMLFRRLHDEPRLPSYIPARTFAQALLDVLGVGEKEVGFNPPLPDAGTTPPAPAANQANADAMANLTRVLQILKRESPLDVNEHLKDLNGLLGNADLPPQVKLRLVDAITRTQTQLQKLHDSVEVWFNNSMDRVSGAYKRTIQGWLFLIGLLIASCSNADTIDMWRRLSTNDQLRDAMAQRAARSLPAVESRVRRAGTVTADTVEVDTTGAANTPLADTTVDGVDTLDVEADSPAPEDTTAENSPAVDPVPAEPGSTDTVPGGTTDADSAAAPRTPADSAWDAHELARAELDSMELKLGWTRESAREAGLLTSRFKPDFFPFDRLGFWAKLLGLLLTAIAISLGAPFWFDLLNKVISIRAAGRSPAEKPKSPEGAPKRAAEETPK